MASSNLIDSLLALLDAQASFILVGGFAAVLQGAPISTFDVDIVYEVSEANVERLLTALQSLDAIFRMQPSRRLVPTRSHLLAGGHLNLLTRSGPLELLGTVGRGLSYAGLLSVTTNIALAGERKSALTRAEADSLPGGSENAHSPSCQHRA